MSSVLTAIGLSSTQEGVHATLQETDGVKFVKAGPALFHPYDRNTKIFISRAVKAAREGRDGAADIGKAAGEVTANHVLAVERLLEKTGQKRSDIDVVGFDGHTILHRTARASDEITRSWQIGDGRTLADEVKIDVVCGFRTADIAAGGRGGPLTPLLHWALARQALDQDAQGVLEIGDAARFIYITPNALEIDIVAFDCGPGSGLLRAFLHRKSTAPIDPASVSAGLVQEEALRFLLLNPFLRRKPPKSLETHDFKLEPLLTLSVEDGVATLRALTAACVSLSSRFFEPPPVEWIVTGEGSEDPLMLGALKNELGPAVTTGAEAGWPGADFDARCHAYLAVRSLKRLPLTYPLTTRALRPATGGAYFRAPA